MKNNKEIKETTVNELKENINHLVQQIDSKEYLEYIETFIKLSSESWLGLKLRVK